MKKIRNRENYLTTAENNEGGKKREELFLIQRARSSEANWKKATVLQYP